MPPSGPGGRVRDRGYISSGPYAGYSRDWQSSIPTAAQMRTNILSNQRAQGMGFANFSDMNANQGEVNRINVLKGRSGQNYGQTANGDYGPGVNMDTGIQGEIDTRQNTVRNWFTRRPYQNSRQGNTMAAGGGISQLNPDQQAAFFSWLQSQGYLR